MEVAESLGLVEFTKLMKASGLSSELDSDTRYTAFVPSDQAFSALPSETLEDLANNKEILRETLLLHLAAGKIVTETMKDNRKITTLDGSEELRINVAEDGEVAHYSLVARLPRVSGIRFSFCPLSRFLYYPVPLFVTKIPCFPVLSYHSSSFAPSLILRCPFLVPELCLFLVNKGVEPSPESNQRRIFHNSVTCFPSLK